MLVKEVKNIAQLMTMSSYDEVVVDSTKSLSTVFPGLFSAKAISKPTQLVIIAKGRIIAGTDLNELKEESVFIKGDSVSLLLPPAKVLDAIVNPSQFEIFIEETGWNEKEVNNLKVKARDLIVSRSIQQGLLKKADVKARQIMENFLRSAGFKKISVH